MNRSTFRSGTKSCALTTFTYLLSIGLHLRHWVFESCWGTLFRFSSWLFFHLNRPLSSLVYTFAKLIPYFQIVSYTLSTMQSRAECKNSGSPYLYRLVWPFFWMYLWPLKLPIRYPIMLSGTRCRFRAQTRPGLARPLSIFWTPTIFRIPCKGGPNDPLGGQQWLPNCLSIWVEERFFQACHHDLHPYPIHIHPIFDVTVHSWKAFW